MSYLHSLVLSNKATDLKKYLETLKNKDSEKKSSIVNSLWVGQQGPEMFRDKTPLQMALAIPASLEIIKLLLSHGATCACSNNGYHPLNLALMVMSRKATPEVRENYKTTVKLLISHFKLNLALPENDFCLENLMKFSVDEIQDITGKKITEIKNALFFATLAENVTVVAALIAGGANVNAGLPAKKLDDYPDQFPLIASCHQRNYPITKLLIDAKADPNCFIQGEYLRTPLIAATHLVGGAPNFDLVKLLIQSKASIYQNTRFNNCILGALATLAQNDDPVSAEVCAYALEESPYNHSSLADTPAKILNIRAVALIHAFICDNIGVVNVLIKYPLNINAEEQVPILDIAAGPGHEIWHTCLTGAMYLDNPQHIDMLLANKANVNQVITHGYYKGFCPLLLAVINKHVETARKLLAHRADPNIVISADAYRGNTLLHIAISIGNLSMAIDLIKFDADLNKKNRKGEAPLLCAMLLNEEEYPDKLKLITLLLDNGADINCLIEAYNASIIEVVESLKKSHPKIYDVFSTAAKTSKTTNTTASTAAMVAVSTEEAKNSAITYSPKMWSLPLPEKIFEAPSYHPEVLCAAYGKVRKPQNILLHHAHWECEQLKKNVAKKEVSFHKLAMHILRASEALIQLIDTNQDQAFCSRKEVRVVRNIIMHASHTLSPQELKDLAGAMLSTLFVKLRNTVEETNELVTTDLTNTLIYKTLFARLKNFKEEEMGEKSLIENICKLLRHAYTCKEIIDKKFKIDFFPQEWDEIKMCIALIGHCYRLLKNKQANLAIFSQTKSLDGQTEAGIRLFFEKCCDLRDEVGHKFSKKNIGTPIKRMANEELYETLERGEELFDHLISKRNCASAAAEPVSLASVK